MYSSIILDHFHNPRNTGPLEGATHYGVAGTPGDGPCMELWFRVKDDKIVEAAYRTYPCPAAIACGSVVAELAKNRSIEQIAPLTAADIARLLGGLPEGKSHCAELSEAALAAALRRVTGGV
jgi:nitrogen fixation NifU-like protein